MIAVDTPRCDETFYLLEDLNTLFIMFIPELSSLHLIHIQRHAFEAPEQNGNIQGCCVILQALSLESSFGFCAICLARCIRLWENKVGEIGSKLPRQSIRLSAIKS